jgi:peptide chain release factor 1
VEIKSLTILTLLVTEVLSNSQTSKGNTGTSTRGLVHLTEHESDLRVAIELNNGGLLHFVVQIVTLPCTLTDTGEDGVTTMGLGDVVDQLLNEDGLAHTGTTEETNLSPTSVRSEQVDNLDTSDQNLGSGGLVSEGRRVSVNRQELIRLDRATLVNGGVRGE